MHVSLSPVRMDMALEASIKGDVLILNGEVFDFSPMPEGAVLPTSAMGSAWFAGPVERVGGVLYLSLILPHGANAPEQTRFPVPITAGDGPVDLPPHDMETDA